MNVPPVGAYDPIEGNNEVDTLSGGNAVGFFCYNMQGVQKRFLFMAQKWSWFFWDAL